MSSKPTSPSIFYKYYLRVSSLSHIEYCPQRSRIECFTNLGRIRNIDPKGAIAAGIKAHWMYNKIYRNFDRLVLKERVPDGVYEKDLDNITIKGQYDEVRIVNYNGKKYSSIIELKTTGKKYMWSREVKAAIKQLQLYMWIMKEHLEEAGFPLWKRGYLEIFSQKNGDLIRRIPVEYDYAIEDWIRDSVKKFQGLSPVRIPPIAYCKLCPKQVKEVCPWYQVRKKVEL